MQTALCFLNRSFDENGSYNPGKEIKAETQTYYQGLIDNRDSPFVVSFPIKSGAIVIDSLQNNATPWFQTLDILFFKNGQYCPV